MTEWLTAIRSTTELLESSVDPQQMLGWKGSNLRSRRQKPLPYHLATSQRESKSNPWNFIQGFTQRESRQKVYHTLFYPTFSCIFVHLTSANSVYSSFCAVLPFCLCNPTPSNDNNLIPTKSNQTDRKISTHRLQNLRLFHRMPIDVLVLNVLQQRNHLSRGFPS